MEGIRCTHGQPKRKAKALRLEHIAQRVDAIQQLPDSAKKRHDLAMALTGFFGAFRRSKLVAIKIPDLIWEPEGLIVQLPKSKTDQQTAGMARALPFSEPNCCPAIAIKQWLEMTDINDGPLFRPVNRWGQVQARPFNPGAVNSLLKGLGMVCQFDFVPDLSSHSLRWGLSKI